MRQPLNLQSSYSTPLRLALCKICWAFAFSICTSSAVFLPLPFVAFSGDTAPVQAAALSPTRIHFAYLEGDLGFTLHSFTVSRTAQESAIEYVACEVTASGKPLKNDMPCHGTSAVLPTTELTALWSQLSSVDWQGLPDRLETISNYSTTVHEAWWDVQLLAPVDTTTVSKQVVIETWHPEAHELDRYVPKDLSRAMHAMLQHVKSLQSTSRMKEDHEAILRAIEHGHRFGPPEIRWVCALAMTLHIKTSTSGNPKNSESMP